MRPRPWWPIIVLVAIFIPLTSSFAQPTPEQDIKVPYGFDHDHPRRRFAYSFSVNAGAYSNIIETIYSGYRWPAETSTLTFSFHSESATPLSDATKDNYRRVFIDVSRFIPIDFVETDAGDLRITRSVDPSYAYAYYPSGSDDDGDIYLRDSYDSVLPFGGATNSFQKSYGSHGFSALVHELGHALGLKHSFEAPACATEDDHQSNTVMTYNFDPYEPATFMRFDVKTLQYLYGERSYNAGDDTYVFADRLDTFVDSAAQTFYDLPYDYFKNIIWDSGGVDTLDISGVPVGLSTRVDLREGGGISYLDDYTLAGNRIATGTILAYGVEIERVVLSAGDDAVYLNDAVNLVSGFNANSASGADTIWNASPADEVRLDAFAQQAVSQERAGEDLVISLPQAGSVTIKGYFAGNSPTVSFADSVLLTPIPTVTSSPTGTPTLSPTAVATASPQPTEVPVPSPTSPPDDGGQEVSIDLDQVGRVRRSVARLEVATYTLDAEDEPVPFKRGAVTVSCVGRQRNVRQSARTNGVGFTVVRVGGVSAGMTCRAEGRFFGQRERSNRVRLR